MSQIKEDLDRLTKETESLALQAIDNAGSDVDRTKVHTRVSFQKKLVAESGEFTLANSRQTQKLSLAVHKDQKKGSASTNMLDRENVAQAVTDVAALAKFSVPDPGLTMADDKIATPASQLPFMWNDNLADIELEEMQGIMAESLARVTCDKRIALDKFELTVDVSSHGLYNSLGVKQSEKQTIAHWVYFGMARDGEEVSTFDYDGNFVLSKDNLQADLMRDAEAFEKSVLQMLGPRNCPSYKGAVLLTPRAVQGLLTGTILFHMSGRQVMDGKSQWDTSVGKKVVSDKISITDRPHVPELSGCTAFDGDGIPTREQKLIDQGKLCLHTFDCYSAKKLGQTPNGLNGGPFAIDIAGGDAALSDLVKHQKNLLVVDRFSGNTDPLKGDFSGVAKASRLYVDGEDAGAVTETMIAGNVLEALQAVIGVSKEVVRPFGSFSCPYILVDGVSVSGQDK